MPRRPSAALLAAMSALPGPGVALSLSEVKGVFDQAISRATALGVNATISLVDREGNILGAVRMTNPALRPDPGASTITGGGSGGLEGVALPSSIFATSKAGTAAFLSTSGNAFSTRTAGFIIQQNFPGGIRNQPAGPLFGVQLSSLPTSDLMRLPIGLSADPGGLPMYRSGQVVAGIGVELDGVYAAPSSRFNQQGGATDEELIAAAGAAGFPAPTSIRADNILVGGVRFPFTKAEVSSSFIGSASSFDARVASGSVRVLVTPGESPATKFSPATAGGIAGDTIFGFQQGFVEAMDIRGGEAFIVRPDANLVRRLSRVDIASGTVTLVAPVSGEGLLRVGLEVDSIALDDRGNADAGDDILYVFGPGRVAAVSAASGAPVALLGAGEPGFPPLTGDVGGEVFPPATRPLRVRSAQVVRSGASVFVVGIDDRTGNVIRLDTSLFNGVLFASTTLAGSAGIVDALASGPLGVFAVRTVTGGGRELVRIPVDGSGVAVIANITDGGPNESRANQPISVLAYNDAGTATTADDTLIAQNSTTGQQFVINPATGAIDAPPITLASPRFVMTSAKVSAGTSLVGIAEQTRQLQRITLSSPGSPGSLASLTSIDTSSLSRAGLDLNGNVALSNAEVQQILGQAHQENARLRAMIRRDRPQISQVSVSVCDAQGNLLAILRTPDAPVFGFDVSLQKARSAMFFSRPDAGAILRSAESGIYAQHADATASTGLALDGSVAIAERTIGFIARPTLPDGIPATGPGPLSNLTPGAFSPFSTGLQTQLIITNVLVYAFEFLSLNDEGAALTLFNRALVGGGGVTVTEFPLQNGLQIFPGGVPLYKNGALVGGVGVSGDGIEQDDSIAFRGATGFQQFGPGVVRADSVRIIKKLRLPYIKFPRRPFDGF